MNNYSNDFYLTLLSNSSRDYFPSNTSAHFFTQLPKSIHLEGEWCVGLSEVQYPCSFTSVGDDDNIVYCEYVYPVKGTTHEEIAQSFFENQKITEWAEELIANGKYANISEVVTAILEDQKKSAEDQVIAIDGRLVKGSYITAARKSKIEPGDYDSIEAILSALNWDSLLIKDDVKFSIDAGSRKVSVTHASNSNLTSVHLSPKLSLQLGFEPYTSILYKTADHPANILLGLPSQLFVYSDIVEPQMIGDVFTKVLRIIACDNTVYTYGSQKAQFFTHPHYMPLLKREFENIEIDIRTDTGDFAPFKFGTVCVKLHFKRLS